MDSLDIDVWGLEPKGSVFPSARRWISGLDYPIHKVMPAGVPLGSAAQNTRARRSQNEFAAASLINKLKRWILLRAVLQTA
jgi:hypothetical protein